MCVVTAAKPATTCCALRRRSEAPAHGSCATRLTAAAEPLSIVASTMYVCGVRGCCQLAGYVLEYVVLVPQRREPEA